ncbi:MAG: D-alanyl-D-alanine carboxypeptidase, partial [Candidatus Latescibacteria bacterium]|nr:D-alanyl-D-alanine carboxypeptidase [Candidatus Latescibacterota bacterium]
PLPEPISEILIEAETGRILFAQEPHRRRPPASTVKTVLELVIMEMVKNGQIKLTDSVRVSANASRIGGSQVFLKEGEVFPLEDLMKAIVIASANDACVAVAEHTAGSVEGFVDLMNQKAEELGLKDSHFVNVHGLDEERIEEGNLTSAHDLSNIARELVKYPEIREWSSIVEAPFRGGTFTLRNTNKLIGQFSGMDGLKTGYTSKSGFCLVATAKRDDLRLISVVMGLPSERVRFEETSRLLSMGLNTYRRVIFARKGDIVGTVKVEAGREDSVRVVTSADIGAVVRRRDVHELQKVFEPEGVAEAPISVGDTLATMKVVLRDTVVTKVAAVAEREIARASFIERIFKIFW